MEDTRRLVPWVLSAKHKSVIDFVHCYRCAFIIIFQISINIKQR